MLQGHLQEAPARVCQHGGFDCFVTPLAMFDRTDEGKYLLAILTANT